MRMDIKEQIQKDRIAAMKSRESDRKAVLDYVLGEIQKKEKDPSAKGDFGIAVIAAYTKSLREFIDQHAEVRPEEAAKYAREIEVLSAYMPKQLSTDELKAAIGEIQASGESRKGMIMKQLKEKHGAAVDGKLAMTLLDQMGLS